MSDELKIHVLETQVQMQKEIIKTLHGTLERVTGKKFPYPPNCDFNEEDCND